MEKDQPPPVVKRGFFENVNQCAMEQEDFESDFEGDNIDDLLSTGVQKAIIIENHTIQDQEFTLATEENEKFTSYLSWQTPTTGDSAIDQDIVPATYLEVNPFSDPFSLNDDHKYA